MPELPEVQTIINHLKPQLINQVIEDFKVYYPAITYHKDFRADLIHQKILDLKRRGKYIIFVCEKTYVIIHLRMEGKFFAQDCDDPIHKHTHASFIFNDFRLDYNDTRKFGRIDICNDLDVYFKDKLGLEPFDKNCTAAYLKAQAKGRSIPVKTFILDQSVLAGVGNIYSDESLFDAKLSPFKSAQKVTLEEFERLITSIRKILSLALKDGGSTIKSFAVSHEINGLFQQHLHVYARGNQACHVCQNILEKARVNGRSCVYCMNCQKVSQNAHRHYRIHGIRKN